MIIKFKKTDITAKMPARGSACAAGYDLFITDPELKLLPGETVAENTIAILMECPIRPLREISSSYRIGLLGIEKGDYPDGK